MKQKNFEQLLIERNGDLAWIENNIVRALQYKCEWKRAREYYDRMMNTEPARMKDSDIFDKGGNIHVYIIFYSIKNFEFNYQSYHFITCSIYDASKSSEDFMRWIDFIRRFESNTFYWLVDEYTE